MKVITYPTDLVKDMPIFLGGSTAKGDWQRQVEAFMADTTAALINTCRPDWDVTEPTREQKNDHIAWEFQWMERIMNYFICIPADTKSPTAMLELGLVLAKPLARAVIYIHPEYSHYHNARLAAAAYGHIIHTDLDEALKRLKDLFLTSRLF